jgi:hypothetical protein
MLSNKTDHANASPSTTERRLAPRFEVLAQANVASGGESYLMTVRNISAAGAFLEGNPKEHADLKIGVDVEIALSASTPGMSDDEIVNIQCSGKVARVELPTGHSAGGFGVTFEVATVLDQAHLEDLLGRLAELPAAQRATHLG